MDAKTTEKRTPQEIEALKREWEVDPCWDIEDTKGFEVHYNELRDWRIQRQEKEAIVEQKRLTDKASQLGCSIELVGYIESLERRLKRQENR